MWKFTVYVVHGFVSSLQPEVGRGFLHVSNVFLFTFRSTDEFGKLEAMCNFGNITIG